ncbi:MAG TPA: PaaI family thioesterase [Arachnia sp.]|jgi:uncharacterized protein (TIGR00369 family)|nr:PaaI family thioesterase [Arachnia sp.]HMR14610.1 PaaI family thioesterase [Arachnia sp.]
MNSVPAWAKDVLSPLDRKLGFVMTELGPERVVGSIPVDGNQQPFGLLHGGATGVLVETLASMGAMAHGYPGRAGVGVDLNVTHLRSARSGRVTGTATALHLGRSVAAYQVEVVDDDGNVTAVGRLTCQMITLPG